MQGVTQDREGYALAAGLALGLITLGKGRAAMGLSDLHLEDKLRCVCVWPSWLWLPVCWWRCGMRLQLQLQSCAVAWLP